MTSTMPQRNAGDSGDEGRRCNTSEKNKSDKKRNVNRDTNTNENDLFTEEILPGVNLHQLKGLARTAMDITQLTNNAQQLRQVLDTPTSRPYYHFTLMAVLLSLTLQMFVTIRLILQYNGRSTNTQDNATLIAVFLIACINVFILAFW